MLEKQNQKQVSIQHVLKRDGTVVPYDNAKIADAIFKAAQAVGGTNKAESFRLAKFVEEFLHVHNLITPSVSQIHDAVEKILIEEGHAKTAKTYILYRARKEEALKTTGTKQDAIAKMFNHESKLSKLATKERLNIYRKVYFALRNLQEEGTLSMHPQNNYLGGNELATDIYNRKYFLKDLKG